MVVVAFGLNQVLLPQVLIRRLACVSPRTNHWMDDFSNVTFRYPQHIGTPCYIVKLSNSHGSEMWKTDRI